MTSRDTVHRFTSCEHNSYLLGCIEILFLGEVLSISEALPSWDDGDLHEWISMLQEPPHHCMPCLVVRYYLLLLRLDHKTLFLKT